MASKGTRIVSINANSTTVIRGNAVNLTAAENAAELGSFGADEIEEMTCIRVTCSSSATVELMSNGTAEPIALWEMGNGPLFIKKTPYRTTPGEMFAIRVTNLVGRVSVEAVVSKLFSSSPGNPGGAGL